MNEETKEEVNKITKKISYIYQKVFSEKNDKIENSQWFETDLNMMHKQLENVKLDLDNKLSKLYDNGANEIDPEVNQLQRQIQEINNWLEDIIPDLLAYIQDLAAQNGNSSEVVNQYDDFEEEIKEETAEEAKEEIENPYFEGEETEEQILDEQIEEETEKFESKEEKIIEEPQKIMEKIQEVVMESIEDVEEEKEVTQEKKIEPIVTIKLGQPSNDYKDIAKTIIEARNHNLETPNKAIENGNSASELVIENIKNILLKNSDD